MSITAFELDPALDFRPAHWRLELAKLVAQDAVPQDARQWVDDVVRRAARAIGGQPDPHIETVLELHYHGPIVDRAEVTARILADQPSDDIAEAVGLPKAVVDLFEQLAFDARNPRARTASIPGVNLVEAIDEDDVEAVLNRVAARHGLAALEPVVSYFRSGLYGVRASEAVSKLSGRQRSALGTCEKLVRVLIEPVDLDGMMKAMREEAAAGGPMLFGEPIGPGARGDA